jgi:RNA polymerase-binding transcription factor DksA
MDADDATFPGEHLHPGEAYASVLTAASGVLDEIDAALRRLADGTYGRCDSCGEPIEEQRLVDEPTARTCRAHLPFDVSD